MRRHLSYSDFLCRNRSKFSAENHRASIDDPKRIKMDK
jgi:hypothetical protein